MSNERITENLVRDLLRELGYYANDNECIVEEQKSGILEVKRLLKTASKQGKGGKGAPEFLISSIDHPDFLLVFECKAETSRHASPNLDRPADFAVDGAIHYAKHLSKSYNVIAIAVSGQTASGLKVSTYIRPKGATESKLLKTEDKATIDALLPFDDYVRHGSFDPDVANNRHADLMAFSREIHDFMRDHGSLTESQKPLLVGGTLIALKNKVFAKTFGDHTPADLQSEWFRVIKLEIEKADIPQAKKDNMAQPYSGIAVHPELGKSKKGFPKGVLHELISMLNERVWPFVSVYHNFDVVGQFYGEFLKYTGGDKKALGIVLTPRHTTELFALIAGLRKTSRVLDICTGTGGYLISGMQNMLKQALTDDERDTIRKDNLVGVEQQPQMYALAASNMILRGDGKANLYQGSCFDAAITAKLKEHRCDVGMINPPYSQGDADLHELRFIQHMLDCLEPGGTGVAIVPMSCAISSHPLREEILKHHTLDAVMSMPDDLFYPVGTVTCILVFKAHVPHAEANRKTWFGYWKKDGFVKTKHRGRIDLYDQWESIRDRWIEAYRNRETHPGESVATMVSAQDEWCAEAYMETDYSSINGACVEQVARDFAAYQIQNRTNTPTPIAQNLYGNTWREFVLGEIFDIRKGKRLTKASMTEGNTPYIGASDKNNGVTAWIGQKPIHSAGTITVAYNGSVAEAFYQPNDFWASDDINVLYPNFEMPPEAALFIAAIIRQEKYRFSYGRKWHLERMREARISLPATPEGAPDIAAMGAIVQSLPFSSAITTQHANTSAADAVPEKEKEPSIVSREEAVAWYRLAVGSFLGGDDQALSSPPLMLREDLEYAADVFRCRFVAEFKKLPDKVLSDLDSGPHEDFNRAVIEEKIGELEKVIETATESIKDNLSFPDGYRKTARQHLPATETASVS